MPKRRYEVVFTNSPATRVVEADDLHLYDSQEGLGWALFSREVGGGRGADVIVLAIPAKGIAEIRLMKP